ncbi:MAG: DNA polymerase III subunit delta [Acidobacteriota bacterium]
MILLWGTEEYLIERRIEAIYRELGSEELPEMVNLDGDETTPLELEEYLGSIPLFSFQRLVVIKRPTWLNSSKTRKGRGFKDVEPLLLEFAQNPAPEVTLILTSEDLPKNTIVDAVKKHGTIEDLQKLNPRQLQSWIADELARSGAAYDKNVPGEIAKSGRDMYFIASEIERLSLCHSGEKITTEHLIYLNPEAPDINIFKLTDALLRKNTPEALKALDVLLQRGEPAPLIVYMITREFLSMGRVKALQKGGKTPQEIGDYLKMQPFRLNKMLDARHNEENIGKAFARLSETDWTLKNVSQNERVVLETLAVDICQ